MSNRETTDKTQTLLLGPFLALLLLTNGHLLSGEPPASYGYNQGAVLSGEWWRLITHPFTHVSWYHLALDSAATVILWSLLPLGPGRKLAVAAISGLMSLGLAVAVSPHIGELGLCGLSGIAHGLMAATGLLLLRGSWREVGRPGSQSPWIGALLLAVAVGKSLFEVIGGTPLFAEMHHGNLGIPIVHAHLGGSLGGMLALALSACDNPSADHQLPFSPKKTRP